MSKILAAAATQLDRTEACVAFCEGAPLEALKPGGLMKSFRDLMPDGDVYQVLILAVEHERVKAENAKLKNWVHELERRLKTYGNEVDEE